MDVGSGSGLFSLAAARLGAAVTSVDFDEDAVYCTESLRSRFFGEKECQWAIFQGSVLDIDFLSSLGSFDIVYSWGVLHHTGDLWKALHLVTRRVNQGGKLFVAIYNDQGPLSELWCVIKRRYNRGGRFTRAALAGSLAAVSFLRGHGPRDTDERGMDWWRDIVDWVGGYPYEVATPGQVFAFCASRGFHLGELETVIGHGCNQYVFTRGDGVSEA